jgi:hypothetical protein
MMDATAVPLRPVRRPPRARSHLARLIGPVATPVTMFVLTLVLAIAHQGKLLELLYTPMSFAIAYYLYRRHPAHYLGFVCWLFFLTPEVRRLADFFNGVFNPKSPIMVAPLLAAMLSGLALLTHYRSLGQRRAAPLLLVMAGVFYGYVVGLVNAGVAPATYDLVNWLFPALIGFRLVTTWREYPAYHRVLLKTFVYGTFAMGAYAIFQFIDPPPWTAFWMLASGMVVDGQAVPFGMRVSSTMNSAGPFANTIMTGILISLAARGRLAAGAVLTGVPALLFTSVRAAWGGALVGLIYPFAMLDGRSRVRLIACVITFAGLCMPLMLINEVSQRLDSRFDTLAHLSQDQSFRERAGFYDTFISTAVSDISGVGLGMTGLSTRLGSGAPKGGVGFDSGVMQVPYVLGWPGTLLYATGMLVMLWRAFMASFARAHDRFAISGAGVAAAILSMMVFIDTLQALPGAFYVIGVLMPVIGLRHAREGQARARAAQPARARAAR